MWAAVGAADVPVLIVQGEDDALTPVSGANALFVSHFSSSSISSSPLSLPSSPFSHRSSFVTIADAGHQIMQEKPLETAASILAFLEGFLDIANSTDSSSDE
jgi:pimeloyl-ACP methyl ester carboxylesterase